MRYLFIALAGATLLGGSAPAQSRSFAAPSSARSVPSDDRSSRLPVITLPRQGDPADSVYRAATAALQRNDYRNAARLFSTVPQRFPRSASAGDALYWQAFALYRLGGMENLRGAIASLNKLKASYPRAKTATGGDADDLTMRVHGELAKLGDEKSRRIVQDAAKGEEDEKEKENKEIEKEEKEAEKEEKEAEKEQRRGGRSSSRCARDEDEDMRVAAVNALMQMRAEQAIPILREVLKKTDDCSISLRRKAVFILSQTRAPEAADILLSVARTDPDEGVRKEAIRWLGDVRGGRSTQVLDSILRATTSSSIRDAALFALSQQRDDRARKVVQAYIENPNTSEEGKRKAIQTLGFHFHQSEDGDYLRGLYPKATGRMKSEIATAIGQIRTRENALFLLGIASDPSEPTDVRKNALFWAKDGQLSVSDIIAIYPKMNSTEMKKQFVFVLAETNSKGAIDRLIEMAKSDPDREVRKQALFWLGQKDDPRVKALLLEIINQ
jgi:HEAT repeat protein